MVGFAPEPGIATISLAQKMRRASLSGLMGTTQGSTSQGLNLGEIHGSLVSYFFAPHPTPGLGVCFSPDGLYLLRYGYTNELKLLHAASCTVAACMVGSMGHVSFATFSHDGRFVIAGTADCELLVFHVEMVGEGRRTLIPISCIDVGLEPLLFCIMSPDDSDLVLSCDSDGQLELWHLREGAMVRRFETGHTSKVANFASGGAHIVSCSDGLIGLVVVDTATSVLIWAEDFSDMAQGRNKPGYSISRDGAKVVAYIKDHDSSLNLALLDVKKQTYMSMHVCEGLVVHVEFSDDGGRFMAAGRDDRIHIFCSTSGHLLGVLEGHASDVLFCRMNKDGRYAISGDNSGTVMMWCLKGFVPLLRLQAHNSSVLMCDLSADGKRAVSLDREGHAHLWNLECRSLFDVLQVDSDSLCSCATTQNSSKMVVGYTNGSLRMWNLELNHVTEAWKHGHHKAPVVIVTISPSQTVLASASRDGKLLLSSVSDGTLLATIDASRRTITGVHFSMSGDMTLVSDRDGILHVWEGLEQATTGLWLASPPTASKTFHASSQVMASDLSADGCLCAAATSNGNVQVWHVASGILHWSAKISDLAATSVQFSASGDLIIVGSEDGSSACFRADGGFVQKLAANSAGVVGAYFQTFPERSEQRKAVQGATEVVTVCARQSISWRLQKADMKVHTADFVADRRGLFRSQAVDKRMFIAHAGLAVYDATVRAAVYDMSVGSSVHPGNSSLFRNAAAITKYGIYQMPLIMHSPPNNPTHMLMDETGGAKALDFSSDGHLIVCGNVRGELSVWDVENKQHVRTWMAHKRSAITCVKFSNDGNNVYSCGEDAKVILWDWRNMTQQGVLSGHTAAVVCVEMSLDGSAMVSGDRSGIVIIWDMISNTPAQVIAAHEGPLLACTVSPNGKWVASSGVDEHISIRDAASGEEVLTLDDALDGKGLTIKFSFDGTRLQVGGEKGNILIWNVAEDCLIFEIQAHEGKVFDCSWSGDSRQLLSVGADGRVRLWDAAAGSELCEANFAEGFGDIETGGFIRGDLSFNGATMAGCTQKGHLIVWDIHKELLRCPDGDMLYKWLAAIPLSQAREAFALLRVQYPLIMNVQDSQGWSLLMHAVADSNAEITGLVCNSVRPKSSALGITASPLSTAPGSASNSNGGKQGVGEGACGKDVDNSARGHAMQLSSIMGTLWQWPPFKGSSSGHSGTGSNGGSDATASFQSSSFGSQGSTHGSEAQGGANALAIALSANNADCVAHLLRAVLEGRVTSGSFYAVTAALPEVAVQYPGLCFDFLQGLPLHELGEMEIPAAIAAHGTIVRASTSYSSYKEMWHEALQLDQVPKGPMVMMQASMVMLPYVADLGTDSILQNLVRSSISVKTYGCDTIKAVIDYKWQKFAKMNIFIKALVYLTFIAFFTAFAIVHADDVPDESLADLASYSRGRASIAFSVIIFVFGLYYLILEVMQMVKLSLTDYFSSFWNFLDISSYSMCLIIPPCHLLRVGVGYHQFIWPMVAIETILLWVKAGFFGLAVDGLGTFIYMTSQLVKGMRYFLIILLIFWVVFGVAFMGLFPVSYVTNGDAPSSSPDSPNVVLIVDSPPGVESPPGIDINTSVAALDNSLAVASDDVLWTQYNTFGKALMNSYMAMYGLTDYGPVEAVGALPTLHPEIAIILICLFNFLMLLLFLSMLILILRDAYKKTRIIQKFVFLENRAGLIVEVESTMTVAKMKAHKIPPFLHLLSPLPANKEAKQEEDENDKDDISGLVDQIIREFTATQQPALQPPLTALPPPSSAPSIGPLHLPPPSSDKSDSRPTSPRGPCAERSVVSHSSLRNSHGWNQLQLPPQIEEEVEEEEYASSKEALVGLRKELERLGSMVRQWSQNNEQRASSAKGHSSAVGDRHSSLVGDIAEPSGRQSSTVGGGAMNAGSQLQASVKLSPEQGLPSSRLDVQLAVDRKYSPRVSLSPNRLNKLTRLEQDNRLDELHRQASMSPDRARSSDRLPLSGRLSSIGGGMQVGIEVGELNQQASPTPNSIGGDGGTQVGELPQEARGVLTTSQNDLSQMLLELESLGQARASESGQAGHDGRTSAQAEPAGGAGLATVEDEEALR